MAAFCKLRLLAWLAGLSYLTLALRAREKEKVAAAAAAWAASKALGGVPVRNYHLAHGGRHLAERQRRPQDPPTVKEPQRAAAASFLGRGRRPRGGDGGGSSDPSSGLEQVALWDEEWLAIFKPGAADAHIEELCRRFPRGNVCNMMGHPSGGGVPFLKVRGSEKDLLHMLKESSASASALAFLEPDLPARAIPELEGIGHGLGEQPAKWRTAPLQSADWGLDRIGVPGRERTGQGVHIYVLDTGMRTSHQDFGGRAVPTLEMTSGRPVLCSPGNRSCALDLAGHGTHCAGITAGATYGVASAAVLHAVQVLEGSGRGAWSWSVGALDWVATRGTRPAVVSMSLGSPGVQHALLAAVDATVSAGVTVVVAAGNENQDACHFSPASVPSAITVGSSGRTDNRSSFSNWGPCVNIFAPGEQITSAGKENDTSTLVLSGTSMACPHVAGGAALQLERNPAWTAQQVLTGLLEHAISGALSGLHSSDPNKLLFVGAGVAKSTCAPWCTPQACATEAACRGCAPCHQAS